MKPQNPNPQEAASRPLGPCLSFDVGRKLAMRIIMLLVLTCTGWAAQAEFVGVMANGNQILFAVREHESAPAKWLTIGGRLGEFVISAYDPKAESLLVKKGKEEIILRLPEAHVKMARDEIVAGLQKILNIQSAKDICDLLHPKLKPLFKDVPCDSIVYSEVLEPGTKVEIREIPEEWSRALAKSLSEIEAVLGVRPTSALWIMVRGRVRTVTSVVQVGDSWYLTPGVPSERK